MLPDDVEIYNAPVLSGYKIQLTALYPDIMYDGCEVVLEYDVTDPTITSYDPVVSCNPMKPIKLEIAATTFVGVGVFNEYCFVVNRTSKQIRFSSSITNNLSLLVMFFVTWRQ